MAKLLKVQKLEHCFISIEKRTAEDGSIVFRVYGGGFGHGVGMSQYGANKLAQNGKNYEEILKHYYQNINIEKISV